MPCYGEAFQCCLTTAASQNTELWRWACWTLTVPPVSWIPPVQDHPSRYSLHLGRLVLSLIFLFSLVVTHFNKLALIQQDYVNSQVLPHFWTRWLKTTQRHIPQLKRVLPPIYILTHPLMLSSIHPPICPPIICVSIHPSTHPHFYPPMNTRVWNCPRQT